MSARKVIPIDLHGTAAHRLITLETELLNIHYLFSLPEVTEEQKKRLRPLLATTQAELRQAYEQLYESVA